MDYHISHMFLIFLHCQSRPRVHTLNRVNGSLYVEHKERRNNSSNVEHNPTINWSTFGNINPQLFHVREQKTS